MTLRVVGESAAPAFVVPFRSAGHAHGATEVPLWVHRAFVAGLPEQLDALFVASDLQGFATASCGSSLLLGYSVAEELLAHAGYRPQDDDADDASEDLADDDDA